MKVGVYTTLPGDDYKSAFDVLSSHSSHHKQILQFVQQHVLPHLPPSPGPRACLDVGAGDGSLAAALSAQAGFRVLAIDSNPASGLAEGPPAPEATPPAPAPGAGAVERRVADFLTAQLPLAHFELVLCSHVLYNMPQPVLEAMLAKMLGCARPGGFLLVLQSAPRGPLHEFTRGLSPGSETSDDVVRAVNKMGMPCRVFPAPNPISLEDAEQVEKVLRFLALENCGGQGSPPGEAAVREAVLRLLPRLARGPGGSSFVLEEESDLILVHKGTRTSFWD